MSMMDPEVSVLLHCTPWKGLREGQVRVELSTRYNRHCLPGLEQQIEEVWRERVTCEPWLFNGAKFRLHSATFTPKFHNKPEADRNEKEQQGEAHAADVHCMLCLPPGQAGCNGPQKWVSGAEGGGTTQQRGKTEPDQTQRTTENTNGAGACKCRDQKTVDVLNSVSLHAYTWTPGAVMHSANVSEAQRESSHCASAYLSVCQGKHPVLTLHLGLTCYKDFLGTNWSKNVEDLVRQGTSQFGDPSSLLAQPLGVGAVLRTSDNLVVFLRRSQKVAEASGLLDIPGGHPEPKAVCMGVNEDSIRVEQLPQEAVVRELFSSVQAEIRDEVNIPLSCLSEPVLMGIALNHTSAGRPSAEFYISCSLTAQEVKDFYLQGGPEASESTDIVFLSRREALQLNESAPLWSDLCPSAKGAVLLYRLVLPDQD
ncbi:uridine diphosphate glucose pyrophosphatase NUDT22 isoform X2 [Brienomyrus brachyistius]|uniref:uridine diphosphate glucose pyrophosphatase NUDT22 isoform X2 n=1 Tax=Brienomyrus brachyistius TaxID=42636 RepID=UPI0020B3655F|nr:uridine diphosphate glucose pyrophosphatase NUDT22 isoform X2 [Brienomyrus brachyistius]XP_048884347.1 uridine diphosphate glucose pyrophosphatase NUDT22 isoform X2 [Brienomyrus brachyistius]XP_048884348.1 uridine diphosphate glucose pyrophosphatase NUDT22 isoform X2 [Brienomyrus brachyistius]XP_048884349.1 uridine diphosphate glucose pyrophosphatase NUDT22 isoform X2 [Brienomyrus brachyistius]XP_048884350.1 uridine diphosphate glucose pyrophosphatase NUDT22 isoform X2 [Brienomyrus brachyist